MNIYGHFFDPPVRVIGYPEGVQEACQRIQMDLLPQNRITMKIDVPWTFHSHIIGKSGQTIQPVVKKTGVSVHFPDGNKNSDTMKSNQVSINSRGNEINGIEEARSAIRGLTPLIFSFCLSATAQFICLSDFNAIVQYIQSVYDVQAELFHHIEDATIFGSVKGSTFDSDRVKEATLWLLKSVCGDLATQIQIHTTLEISPQFHVYIIGRYKDNIKKIIKSTSTKIVLPDLNEAMLPILKRSTVTIYGAIFNVFEAREKIIGSIPVVLMFDIHPEQLITEPELHQIRQTYKVEANVRSRFDGTGRSIVVKGAERNIDSVYESWRILSKTNKIIPKAKIPSTYHLDDSPVYHTTSPLISPVLYATSPPKEAIYFDYSMNMINRSSPEQEINNNVIIKPDDSPVTSRIHSPLPSIGITDEEYAQLEALVNAPDRRAPGCEKDSQKILSGYLSKKMLAEEVIKQPIVPVERFPNPEWAGIGLSKSQPATSFNKIKEDFVKLDENFKNWQSNKWKTDSLNSSATTNSSSWNGNAYLTSSQYYETDFMKSLLSPNSFFQTSTLLNILICLRLEEYYELFSSYGIDLDTFCHLTESNLIDIGVTSLLHREKIMIASKRLRLYQNDWKPEEY